MSDHSQERFRKPICCSLIRSLILRFGSIRSQLAGRYPPVRRARCPVPSAAAATGGPAAPRPAPSRRHVRATRRRFPRPAPRPSRHRPRRVGPRRRSAPLLRPAPGWRPAPRRSTAARLATSPTQRSSTARSCSRPRMPTTHTVSSRPDQPARHQPGDGQARRQPGEQPADAERDAETEAGAQHHHQPRLQPAGLQAAARAPPAAGRRRRLAARSARVRSRRRRDVR